MFNKNIARKISWLAVVAIFATACQQEEIDDISRVDPGEDQSAPELQITSPSNGMDFQTTTETLMIDLAFEAVDDIRITNAVVELNGQEIENYSDFTDYRIVIKEIPFELTDGDYTFTVTVTDVVGNVTTETINFSKATVDYLPQFDGEAFYMNFNGNYTEFINNAEIAVVGQPGYAGEAQIGSNSYAGNTNSYLTTPIDQLASQTFSASFWYKIDANQERAGVLTASPLQNPETPDGPQNLRTSGFRLFREGTGTFKLNVGNGSGESWNDGGSIDTSLNEWVHIAFTISETETVIYFNGSPVNTGTLSAPISWEGVDFISIMSGEPRFTEWGHLSDISFIDDLRFFNKALTEEEVNEVMQYTEE
ncbi:LamG domain-containing protein [Mesonia sp.]|uniref:LamG domain-containing protein n=1 Tax=Mesonia sp. TaxID=1960830 RepID=UPI00177A37C7|nr:LamG domain-containing protein [Mesonia sp.]HIB36001.1 LamG domain-containing protein [Mesonia sp.]HIO26324.1 LamG domain-containing protein [Flavobacteriaceae bacterium]